MKNGESPSRAALWKVYAALMALLALSVGATFAPIGAWHSPVALTIAAAKALLVLAVFMEAAYGDPIVLIWVVAGFYWLAILLTLSMSDYLTRH